MAMIIMVATHASSTHTTINTTNSTLTGSLVVATDDDDANNDDDEEVNDDDANNNEEENDDLVILRYTEFVVLITEDVCVTAGVVDGCFAMALTILLAMATEGAFVDGLRGTGEGEGGKHSPVILGRNVSSVLVLTAHCST